MDSGTQPEAYLFAILSLAIHIIFILHIYDTFMFCNLWLNHAENTRTSAHGTRAWNTTFHLHNLRKFQQHKARSVFCFHCHSLTMGQ